MNWRISVTAVEHGNKLKPFWRTVAFAVAVGLLVLGGALIPAIMDLIRYMDQHGAYFFNSAAGQSPVFDRIVLLVADEDGRERIITLAAIWFIVAVWLAPTRLAKSRLLGTFLYIALVLFLYILVDSLLDDVIERKSPSMEFLQPFNHIGQILDIRVDVTYRRTFPDLIAVILFIIGFMLLRLGRRLGGYVTLLLGATVPLLLCVAGLTWLSDIYLGALPIAFIVSAVAVETPFRRVHGSLVDLAAAGLDESVRSARGIVPMWKHRRLYWKSQNVFHMEVATKRFVNKAVRPLLDPDDDDPQGYAPVIEVPLGGLRSVVRIVRHDDKGVVVRAYPLNRRYEAQQHFQASTFLHKHGVRVPEVLEYVNSPAKYGAIFLVEEFIQGRSKRVGELTDEDIRSAAVELARLHNITSEVWGPIDLPRTEDYGNVLLRRVEKQLSRAVRGRPLIGQVSHSGVIRQWFDSWRDDLNGIRRFNLIHGKLHRENCIFEDAGGFCLIDTTTILWEIGASDLVEVHHSLCGGDAGKIEKLNDIYLAELDPEMRDQGQHFLQLYEALFFLSQVRKNLKRLERGGRRPPVAAMEKATYWWRRLTQLVEENPRG